MRVEDLRPLAIFEGVSDDRLAQLVAVGDEVSVAPGDEVFHEGAPADAWWVLLDGAVDLFRTVGREEARVGRMDVPGRWAGGFQAWDEHGVYLASGRVVEAGRLLRVPAAELRALMEQWLPLAVHLVRGVFGTARSIEATVRQRESLITLGTLSAGLAHELNNPAAAAVRTVETMGETLDALLQLPRRAGRGRDHRRAVPRARPAASRDRPRPSARTAMEVSDAEDELGGWLEDHGVDDPWTLASTLAAAGVPVSWCDEAATLLPGAALQAGLEWVAGTMSVGAQLSELREATGRVSQLVNAVRSYTQMDRAALQQMDVVEGLESTLVILQRQAEEGRRRRPRLRPRPAADRRVRRRAQPGLDEPHRQRRRRDGRPRHPPRHHSGRRRSRRRGDRRHRSRASTPRSRRGPSTRSTRPRTSASGTGLGLDTARRIVVERHEGSISSSARATRPSYASPSPASSAGRGGAWPRSKPRCRAGAHVSTGGPHAEPRDPALRRRARRRRRRPARRPAPGPSGRRAAAVRALRGPRGCPRRGGRRVRRRGRLGLRRRVGRPRRRLPPRRSQGGLGVGTQRLGGGRRSRRRGGRDRPRPLRRRGHPLGRGGADRPLRAAAVVRHRLDRQLVPPGLRPPAHARHPRARRRRPRPGGPRRAAAGTRGHSGARAPRHGAHRPTRRSRRPSPRVLSTSTRSGWRTGRRTSTTRSSGTSSSSTRARSSAAPWAARWKCPRATRARHVRTALRSSGSPPSSPRPAASASAGPSARRCRPGHCPRATPASSPTGARPTCSRHGPGGGWATATPSPACTGWSGTEARRAPSGATAVASGRPRRRRSRRSS